MDSIKKQHLEAIDSGAEIYHQFLQKYKRSNSVYTFYEGKDDTSYYNAFVINSFPVEFRHEYFICKNRKAVFNTYKNFDWKRFSKNNILFFVDKDFSDFLRITETITDENIYISDGYSIENNLVTEENAIRVLKEVYNFHKLNDTQLDIVIDLFNKAVNDFVEFSFPLMAYIICWHNEGCNPVCNEIFVGDSYVIECGKFKSNISINDLIRLISDEKIYTISTTSPSEIEIEMVRRYEKKYMIRGKYLIEFFIKYLNSIYSDIQEIIPGYRKEKMHINVSPSNAILLIGPRLRAPESLRRFIVNKVAALT